MNSQSSGFGKRLLLFLIISFTVFFCFKMFAPSRAQNSEERELEDKIPKQVPIKVKIKSEKQKSFKDLKNSKWVRDFELEITNTSDKPIYFLELWIVLPEVITENGMELGFPLRYGRSDFIKFKTLSLPEDVPIQPGEQYVFQIPNNYQLGWNAHWPKQNKPEPSRVQIKFIQLSFGDGSGFNGTDAKPYPYKKELRSACREGPQQPPFTLSRTDTRNSFRSSATDSVFFAPAQFPPVNFFCAKVC